MDTAQAATALFKVLKEPQSGEMLSIDIESEGHSHIDSPILGIGFSFEDFRAYYVPFEIAQKYLFDIKEICESNWLIGGQNCKYEKIFLQRYGISINIRWDSLLAAYIMTEYYDAYNLTALAQRFFPDEKLYTIDRYLSKEQIRAGKFSLMPEEYLAKHCCQDCDMSRRLMNIFSQPLGL